MAFAKDLPLAEYQKDVRLAAARTPRWFPTRSVLDLNLDRLVDPRFDGAPGAARFGTVKLDQALDGVRTAVVLGTAGLGKSWALRSRIAAADPSVFPVWMHAYSLAAAWQSGGSLREVVARAGRRSSRSASGEATERLIHERLWSMPTLIAVDGLDEVHDVMLRSELEAALEALVMEVRQHDDAQLIAASRPAGFRPLAPDFDADEDATEVVLQLVPLESTQVDRFFSSWTAIIGGDVAMRRLQRVAAPPSPLRDATSVPLLASLCAWVAETEDVALTHAGLYDQVIGRFLTQSWKEHDLGAAGRAIDPARSAVIRRALSHLAFTMATHPAGWAEQIGPAECEAVLGDAGDLPVPPGRTKTWSMCFEVGALTPLGDGLDSDAPIGWVHRSFQDFLAGENLLRTLPDVKETLAAYAADPAWTSLISLAATGPAAAAEDVDALCETLLTLATVGADGLGVVTELCARVLAATDRRGPPLDQLAMHVARRLRQGLVDPLLAAHALGGDAVEGLQSLVDQGFADRVVLQALCAAGASGWASLESIIENRANVSGAAEILAEVDGPRAAKALIQRAANGLGIGARDGRVVSHADDAVRAGILRRYNDDPANPAVADLAGAAAREDEIGVFVANLSHPNPDARFGALNAIIVMKSFNADRSTIEAVARLAVNDDSPLVRQTASNLMQTWRIGTPTARQVSIEGSETSLGSRPRDAATLVTSLLAGTTDDVGTAYELLAHQPDVAALPVVMAAEESMRHEVLGGRYHWRWLPSYLKFRPDDVEVILNHLEVADETATVQSAAITIAPIESIEAGRRLDAIAAAMCRINDRWVDAAWATVAEMHPYEAARCFRRVFDKAQTAVPPHALHHLTTRTARALDQLDRTTQKELRAELGTAVRDYLDRLDAEPQVSGRR